MTPKRKEFLIKKIENRREAIQQIREKVRDYVSGQRTKRWRWIVKPEAIAREDGHWDVYGRIELVGNKS